MKQERLTRSISASEISGLVESGVCKDCRTSLLVAGEQPKECT